MAIFITQGKAGVAAVVESRMGPCTAGKAAPCMSPSRAGTG